MPSLALVVVTVFQFFLSSSFFHSSTPPSSSSLSVVNLFPASPHPIFSSLTMSSPDGSGPRPKRPGTGGRHSSSWLNRLHRHHDKKHHHVEEQRPLLSDDQPTDEDGDVEPQATSTTNTPTQEFMAAARGALSHLVHKIRQKTADNWKAIVAAIMLALLTALVATGVAYYKKAHASSTVCMSPTCVAAAASILYNLDPSVPGGAGPYTYTGASSIDPCENFDQYSCGGFDRHELRPDQGSMFTGTLVRTYSDLPIESSYWYIQDLADLCTETDVRGVTEHPSSHPRRRYGNV